MKMITVAGPPSSGKTSALIRLIELYRSFGMTVGVVKFDCLTSFDQELYANAGIPVAVGYSGKICPDHFFVSNVEDALEWGIRQKFDLLITESAGLCNRCSPYMINIPAVCVIDCVAGTRAPRKIGPMIKMADFVVITKGDIVSQAEREVFAAHVRLVNHAAKIIFVNGITGQGIFTLYKYLTLSDDLNTLRGRKLRFTVPSAVCSYCTGETRIGERHQMGMLRKMTFPDEEERPGQVTAGRGEDVLPCPVSSAAPRALKNLAIQSLEILGGQDKNGLPERRSLLVHPGDIISIVGPTGSGKSQLLGDIECLSQGDTPTGRRILINGETPSDESRFDMSSRLVAQLSQNMNFIMDISARDFLVTHFHTRFPGLDTEAVTERCLAQANQLSGEPFSPDTKVTQLSGGQSRALMIADTAFISESPIVLIDEIENAGINREAALKLLSRRDKIIFISTHDPILALSADRRVVIQNGAIRRVIETSEEETRSLRDIKKLDHILLDLRNRLRQGESIDNHFMDSLKTPEIYLKEDKELCGNYMTV